MFTSYKSTDSDYYLEEELESNNSNDLLPVAQSETNPDRTKLLEKEVENLTEKVSFLEPKNNVVKVEHYKQMKNELRKLRNYNYENIS